MEMPDKPENGYEIYKWVKGSIYEGEWKDAKKNGQGVFTIRFVGFELKYVGEFRNGRGWNIFTYDENEEIVGKTVNGEKIGQ